MSVGRSGTKWKGDERVDEDKLKELIQPVIAAADDLQGVIYNPNAIDDPSPGHFPSLWYSCQFAQSQELAFGKNWKKLQEEGSRGPVVQPTTDERECVDNEEVLGMEVEEYIPSEYLEDASTFVGGSIFSNNKPKQQPKPTTTTNTNRLFLLSATTEPKSKKKPHVSDLDIFDDDVTQYSSSKALIYSNRKATTM